MASTILTPEDAIYEAADSETIPAKPNFFMLNRFLKTLGINTDLCAPGEWLKKYEQARNHLREIEDAAKQVGRSQDVPGQTAGGTVKEWPEETSSRCDLKNDSAYQSETSTDQNFRPEVVLALVPGVDEDIWPDGIAVTTCSYSEDDNENYILQPKSRRFKLQPGADGKVTLSFCWKYKGPSEVRKFTVCPLDEVAVTSDIRLGMKLPAVEPPEGIVENAIDEGDEEVEDIEVSALTKSREPSIDLTNDSMIMIAIGTSVAHLQFCNGDKDPSNLGRGIRAAVAAAKGEKHVRQNAP